VLLDSHCRAAATLCRHARREYAAAALHHGGSDGGGGDAGRSRKLRVLASSWKKRLSLLANLSQQYQTSAISPKFWPQFGNFSQSLKHRGRRCLHQLCILYNTLNATVINLGFLLF
jgi:hypothetical protein